MPPCPHPSRGPPGKCIFLGCTLVSPIATKVPGPHWAWFLTSRPPSSSGFSHRTPQELFLSLLACHPLSFTSLPSWDFFQQIPSAPPSLIWPLPPQFLPFFLNSSFTSFTRSLGKQWLRPASVPAPRIPVMNLRRSQPHGGRLDHLRELQFPRQGAITELSSGLPEEP